MTTSETPAPLTMQVRELALESIERKRGFHGHLVVYLIVNGALWTLWAVLWATGSTWFPWPVFPTLGWGIGIALHASSVYLASRPPTEVEIEREIHRLGLR